MSIKVVIKGANFTGVGLGTVQNPEYPNGGGEGGIDSSAQAYFNLVTGLSDAQKNAVNAMVVSLKNQGLWNKITGIYPFMGTGQTSRGANLKDTTKSLSYVGYNAASETASGWLGTTGMYAKTNLASNWSNDFIYCNLSAITGSNVAFMHCDNITNSFAAIIRQSANGLVAGANGGVWHNFATGKLSGSFLASYNNGAIEMYASGTKTSATYSTTSVQSNMQIMAYTNGNAIPVNHTIKISAMGNYLTESEVTKFNAIVDAFLASIGR